MLGAMIGMALSMLTDHGNTVVFAEVLSIFFIVVSGASVAMFMFGQLACLLNAVKAGEFKWISIALTMEALGFLLFYIRVQVSVGDSLVDGFGFIQGMTNLVAIIAFLLYVRQVATSAGQHAIVEEAEKVAKLVVFALIMFEGFNFVAVYLED